MRKMRMMRTTIAIPEDSFRQAKTEVAFRFTTIGRGGRRFRGLALVLLPDSGRTRSSRY